jgi:hypothetical protein
MRRLPTSGVAAIFAFILILSTAAHEAWAEPVCDGGDLVANGPKP